MSMGEIQKIIDIGANKVANVIAEMVVDVIKKLSEAEYQFTDKHTSFIHGEIVKRAIELLPNLIASKFKNKSS